MSAKAAAPALILAAMSLVGDYSAVAERSNSAVHPTQQAIPHKKAEIHSAISKLVRDWNQLDTDYLPIISAVVAYNTLNDDFFLKNMQLLEQVRQLEVVMKEAAVPEPLAADHLALRRAIAKVRTRMATIDNQFRQHFVQPEEFPSLMSGAALADLAEHTTRQLAKLA